jgi:23S rRNA (cytosine1962-C5)-methyltransferase
MALEVLERAFSVRTPLFSSLKESRTDCYRFFSGAAEGVDGLIIEVFGPVAVFQFHVGKCALNDSALTEYAEWCLSRLGVKAVYLKRFVPDRSALSVADPALRSSQPFLGSVLGPSVVTQENGLEFLIRPYEGFSVGLFLDQRENRRSLGFSVGKGERVLNLFSYTCAFSVYCAAQGAEVTSVDVSSKYLDWGKANFEQNGYSASGHRFFCADARYFLRAAMKRKEAYSLIILDPPSFARGKKQEPFSVRKDLASVLAQCSQVLAPGGQLFVSTNLSTWGEAELQKAVEKSMGSTRSKRLPPIPFDFSLDSPTITCRWLQR